MCASVLNFSFDLTHILVCLCADGVMMMYIYILCW